MFKSSLNRIAGFVVAGAVGGAAPGVYAVDLSNNLENPSSGVESATNIRWLAASFGTGTAAHTLNAVTLNLANTSPGIAQVSIYSDGLEPGTLVGTLMSPMTYPSTLMPTTFTTNGIPLAANTTYWVVLRPMSGQFDWSWSNDNGGNGAGFQAIWGISEDAGAFWWSHDNYPTQMSVVVDLPTCAADFNRNGVLNSQDFFDFLSAFFADLPQADFNNNGTVNSQDFFDFVAAFFTGC